MNVELTRTVALYPSAVFVQWHATDCDGGTFELLRSGSPTGPWETVAIGVNGYHAVDDRYDAEGPNAYSLAREVYYRVRVGDLMSKPRRVEPNLPRHTMMLKRKMQYDLRLGLRAHNGVRGFVLKRRRWGTRCAACYDTATRDSTFEHCAQCYGTTYVGGYWLPAGILMRRETAPVQTQVAPRGKTEQKYAGFLLLDYPALEQDDLIVEAETNSRWLVDIVTPTTLRGVPVHQKAVCSEIARDAVEYQVLVDAPTVLY